MSVPGKRTRTDIKQDAQDILMDAIAKARGYHDPSANGMHYSGPEAEQLREIMQREANRVAKLFGYDQAWTA